MNTLSDKPHPPAQSFDLPDVYDPDDVGARSPMLQQIRPKLEPSPSPPPMIPLPDVHPDKGPSWERNRPSMGDGVLVHFMGSGKYQDVSRMVAKEPLASPEEEWRNKMERDKASGLIRDTKERVEPAERKERPHKETEREDLAAIAAKALSRSKEQTPPRVSAEASVGLESASTQRPPSTEAMEDVRPSIPSIIMGTSQPRPILDIPARTDVLGPQASALPPMQQLPSPVSGNNTLTLPSLLESVGNLKDLPDTPRDNLAFSHSPPAPPPPLFNANPGQGSPPKSPIDLRALTSSGRNFFLQQPRRPAHVESQAYAANAEYSSSNAETPSDQSTPGTALSDNRMSIEGITNPLVGGFQCTYDGCTAAPFQTQYLLNSHANVHSQNRPHYCSVKGCPRSEGGKGFKRKNEMIRHGLVHESPGYVCPFCPDREHKYPRPDNLQRHVRVHHVDKNRDDPLLRDVLAQRPEGLNKGRRRRGGTG